MKPKGMTSEEMVDATRYHRLFMKVSLHMQWNANKTATWFKTENPLLGNITPQRMYLSGRIDKLEQFVNGLIEEGTLDDTKN